jgi:hypothetical protein
MFNASNGIWENVPHQTAPVAAQWLHIVSGINGKYGFLYVNGVSSTTPLSPYIWGTKNTARNTGRPVTIGCINTGTANGQFFNGIIDEVELSNVGRDSNWVKLSYQTQVPGQTVVTLGATTTTVAPPVAPTLLLPVNAAVNIVVVPTLTWGTVSGAATYRVQVSAVSNFSTLSVDDSTLTVGTKTVAAALSGNAVYYWRVYAANEGGISAWSTVFSFTTVPAAPAAPILTLPANAAINIALTPTLTWGTVPGAVTYRVQLSTSSAFGTTIADDSTLTAGSKAITGLANNTQYYWRANAKNAGGTSAYSTVFSFLTIPVAPVAPVLTAPANLATGQSRNPTMTWGTVTGAATYRVQLSTISTFTSTVVDDSTLTVATKVVATNLLNNNTVYYWRADANNTGGTGAWSAVWSFTVVPVGIANGKNHYAPAGMGHNGVLDVYMVNGTRVMEIAYGPSSMKSQLLNSASRSLAKGYYTYRFHGTDADVQIVGRLIK